MDDKTRFDYFTFFNEIGIISQLSRSILEQHLPPGMLISHFSVLNHLLRVGEGCTPQGLARAFQVPKTSMTHTLAVLEKHKLIKMTPNPADGRSKTIWITGDGRNFRNNAIAALAPDIDTLAEKLDATEISALTARLAEVRQTMDDARNQ